MTEPEPTALTEDDLAKRRVPCLIAYLHPFRIIESDALSPWNVTIEQVNRQSWDYAALHEIAGGIDVGLPAPYHLVLARDGALALPPIKDLWPDQAAVEFFNRCLAGLLIGGIYCEAITPDGLDTGSIIDWRYVRSHKSGPAAPNRFHEQIRYGHASTLEAIALHRPRTISMTILTAAMKTGLDVLGRVSSMRGEYLLKGATGIARRDWGAALANLWIVAEQLTSELWSREVVNPTLSEDPSKSRRDQLGDTRTWTASARIELLFQKRLLTLDTFKALSVARKARNDLSHEGKHPSEDDARSAYEGVCGLLSVALTGERPPLLDLDLADHALSDPFAPPEPLKGAPEFWMEIPKLPGELELEKAEASLRARKRQ
ncbi:hypothetical protein RJ527_04505 [Thalassospiraceae bacterium LMO-SO8]|nr:DUF4145 domain-containing protein [Alphaproteobacteria bacterium LMO-S08]WND77011.1 hypothetical protein RJ527_04505 [Thalassospiraceae bacterium LMO-SO8]